jgi:hypothetical protein
MKIRIAVMLALLMGMLSMQACFFPGGGGHGHGGGYYGPSYYYRR